jgi:hypothetical protein
VEKFGAASRAERVEALSESALEFRRVSRPKATPSNRRSGVGLARLI